MPDTFADASAALKAAQIRMDAFVIERARALFENYDRFPENDNVLGFEGGCMTKEGAREAAIRSLHRHKDVADALAHIKENTRVTRMVDFTPALDESLRVRAFRAGRTKGEIILEACTIYFAALALHEEQNPEPKRAPAKQKIIRGTSSN